MGGAPLPNFAGIPGSVAAAAAAGVLAGSSTVQSVALAANIVGAASTVAGVASQITATTFTNAAASLPNCDATYIGTQTITVPAGQGALNVSGNSIFQGNVGVTQNINVGGNVTASKLLATQGISADGGNIVLGNPDLTTFATGINIGGGAVAGAGVGGAQASTGNVSAIAIGNGANAPQAGATALGSGSQALAASSTAIGPGATVAAAAGPGSFAGGTSTVLGGSGAVSIGNLNTATGQGAVAFGNLNTATGGGGRNG